MISVTYYFGKFWYLGMPRKLKFYQTKAKKLPEKLPSPPFCLSLPLTAYLTAPVSDLSHLCHRLATQTLPDGWVVQSPDLSDDGSLIISSSPIVDPSTLVATITFVVKVDSHLKWSISSHGIIRS